MLETLRVASRTPGVLMLLTGNFAVAIGSNIVIPYLAIFLTQEQQLSPFVVAAAISVKFWSQQGLSMVGGALADRLGPVAAMCSGLLVRAMSYLLLISVSGPAPVIAACAILGFGGAIYVPASKLALVRLLGTGTQLTTAFALRNTANNAGSALGPLFGSALLLLADIRIGFVVTSAIYVILAILLWRLRASTDVAQSPTVQPTKDEALESDIASVDRRKFAWVIFCAFAFGFCYIQLEYALPVFAASVQNSSIVGILFTINAVAVVVLQVPLNQLANRIDRSALVLSVSLLVMSASFGAAFLGSVVGLIGCVLLLSVAEVLMAPRIDSDMTTAIPAHRRGMAFGFVGTAIAGGSACANGLAAMLASSDGAPEHRFWIVLLVVSAGFAVTVYFTSPEPRVKSVAGS